MKQNGSPCSVIVGNLAEVSLATQTWFLAEDKERWCCYSAAVTALASNSNSLDFVFSSVVASVSAGVIIVMKSGWFISPGPGLSNQQSKTEMISFLTASWRFVKELNLNRLDLCLKKFAVWKKTWNNKCCEACSVWSTPIRIIVWI